MIYSTVSLLDLGRQEEAEKLFERALQSDVHHLEASYNRGLLLWRSARMTDDVLAKQLEEVRTTHEGDWRVGYYLGLVYMERGDGESALKVLEQASRQAPQEEEVQRALKVTRRSQGEWHSWVRSFEGHTSWVFSVSISPDGRWALSGSGSHFFEEEEHVVCLWNLATGQCVRKFEGHTGSVFSVSISPDGRWGLSGSRDETLRLWELATGRCLRTLEGHRGKVFSVSISPDGRWGLSGSEDGMLWLWELATGQCVRTFEGHEWAVNSVSISLDGRWALSGSYDKTLRLWELATGRCVRTFEGHAGSVTSVSINPDGRWGLSGSEDETLRLWELATGRCLRTLEGHRGEVSSVAFSPDGRWGLSGSSDETLRLWELATGRCVRTFTGHKSVASTLLVGHVSSVTFSPDGRWALSGSWDSTLRLWELKGNGSPAPLAVARPRSSAEVTGAETEVRRALESAKSALKQGDASRAAAEVSGARRVPGYERHEELMELCRQIGLRGRLKCFSRGWLHPTFKRSADGAESVSISPDGRWLLTSNKTLRLWELTTGQCVRTFEGHTSLVHSVSISPDGRLAVSGSEDKTLRLWELATGWCLRTFKGHSDEVSSVIFSPDGRWVLSGSDDETLRLWELATGRCVRTFIGHTTDLNSLDLRDVRSMHLGLVNSVSISPDGRWALSGSWDKTLRLWELATGRSLRTFEGHTDRVNSVTFSPDGRWALSGSNDKMLRLWELATGRCLRTFEGHTGAVYSVSISPDGRWALSGSYDKTLGLWELATGQCVRTFEGPELQVNSVTFSPDGRWALSGDGGQLARWELDWECEFPSPSDWDEGARPYLESFLILHTPYAAELPRDHAPSEEEVRLALIHCGKPSWNEQGFDSLIRQLQYAGYGWLRPKGVRKQLEEMANKREDKPASASIFSKLFGKKH